MMNNLTASHTLRETCWLVWSLSVREYRQRYQGSLLGPLWPFLYTCATVALYSFVFSIVLKVKWQQAGVGTVSDQPFWLILLAGQFVYYFVVEIASKAPVMVLSVPNYVKKVRFPLHALPFVSLLVALWNAAITFGILLGVTLWFNGFSWTLLLAPLLFIPLSLWCLGLSWLLGCLGVFFRDLQQIVPLVTLLLLFATPVFYPLSAVPESLQFWVNLNPLTIMIQALRDLMLWHTLPPWEGLAISTVLSALFAWGSFCVFQRMRETFADVM